MNAVTTAPTRIASFVTKGRFIRFSGMPQGGALGRGGRGAGPEPGRTTRPPVHYRRWAPDRQVKGATIVDICGVGPCNRGGISSGAVSCQRSANLDRALDGEP